MSDTYLPLKHWRTVNYLLPWNRVNWMLFSTLLVTNNLWNIRVDTTYFVQSTSCIVLSPFSLSTVCNTHRQMWLSQPVEKCICGRSKPCLPWQRELRYSVLLTIINELIVFNNLRWLFRAWLRASVFCCQFFQSHKILRLVQLKPNIWKREQLL